MKRTARTKLPKSDSGSKRIDQLMDDVYREMFHLESRRLGAELGLALALLRAGVAADLPSECSNEWDWLRTVCPLCLKMIEDSLNRRAAAALLQQFSCDPAAKS